MVLPSLIAALLLGLALLVVGLRGRRTDDHPLCRRCGFDLTGKPGDSTRCPECGADVTRPRAVVLGHRQRRRRPLVAGVLVSLLAAAALGVIGWDVAGRVDWWAVEPAWLLLRQASSGNPGWRTPALRELSGRAGPFDTGRWDAVAAAATAYEADANRPWDPAWGTLLAAAPADRRPSPGRWGAYVEGLAGAATSANPARRTAALDELVARLADTPVDDATRGRVVGRGLDVQGDATVTWDPKWGDVLEGAHAGGHMTAAQWLRYAAQAMPTTAFGVRVRPRVRRGDPLPYWLDESGMRGPTMTSALRYRIARLRLVWDGRPPPPDHWGNGWSSGGLAGSGGATGSSVQPDQFPPGVPDGTQHVRLTATAGVYPITANGEVDEKATPLFQRTVDLPATFDLLPADHPTVQVVHDPSLANAIKKSLTVDSVEQQAGGYAYVHVNLSVNGPTTGLAFHIALVQGGHEIDAGTLACRAGTRGQSYGTGGAGRLTGPTADVVLRGDPAVAAGTVDAFAAWDGTVVFKDVPVKYR